LRAPQLFYGKKDRKIVQSLSDVWAAVCEVVKNKISDVGYNTWISAITPLSMQESEVFFSVPTVFQRDVLIQHYALHLNAAFETVLGFPVTLVITAEDEGRDEEPLHEKPVNPAPLTGSGYEYTFDTFIVGSSNRFAHAASLAVSENPAITYNPLFIYGNSGVGKTHLLLAIYNHICQKYPQKNIIYCRSEDFTNQIIAAIHSGTTHAFHEKYRQCDVLLIDDIQFIAGKDSTQEEFFNTFNELHQSGRQIVLTSDRPPKDIKTLDARIRSRFEAGLIADVQPPDFETRVGIIRRKAQILNITLEENVVYFIAEKIQMNTRQLEGVVKRLQAVIMLRQGVANIAAAQNIIRDIRNDDLEEPVTVERIITEVSRSYNVTPSDIFSKKRDAVISNARQTAMYIVRNITQISMQNIGKEFGRDHSTVVYALHACETKIQNNQKEAELINDIITNLKKPE